MCRAGRGRGVSHHGDGPELVDGAAAAEVPDEGFGLLLPLPGEEKGPAPEWLPPLVAAAAAATAALRNSCEGPQRRSVPSSEAETRR